MDFPEPPRWLVARLDQAVVVGLPQMIASASAPIQGTKREVGS